MPRIKIHYKLKKPQNKTTILTTTMVNTNQVVEYNRADELKRFDASKAGVKGLSDSGITAIPEIFVHPPETLRTLRADPTARGLSVPLVDLSAPRPEAVRQLRLAAREPGIFHVVNHGVPEAAMARAAAAVRAFHEGPAAAKAAFYGGGGGGGGGVAYRSNFDLFESKAANWHDTVRISTAPERAAEELIPEVLRGAAEEWDREVGRFGEGLLGMLGEGLGLDEGRLRGLTCGDRRMFVGHYYPPCPQPHRTVGLASHADPGLLTVLLQNQVGGLQIKSSKGVWVDVKPVPGALVINVGVLFQILSNDAYWAVEHRVLANSGKEPRVSVVVFLNPSNRAGCFGPLEELVSPDKPALYRKITYEEFIQRFLAKELDGKSFKDHFRV